MGFPATPPFVFLDPPVRRKSHDRLEFSAFANTAWPSELENRNDTTIFDRARQEMFKCLLLPCFLLGLVLSYQRHQFSSALASTLPVQSSS